MAQPIPDDFAAYVAARQQQLLRAAYLVCGDYQLAEDLLQAAFVKLALRWDRIRVENPDGYVRTILYRDAVSAWRKRRREVVVPIHPERLVSSGVEAGAVDRVDLTAALSQLTPKQRAVIVLRFFDDRSVAETADALGISEGTVKSQTSAALERLRAIMPGVLVEEIS